MQQIFNFEEDVNNEDSRLFRNVYPFKLELEAV